MALSWYGSGAPEDDWHESDDGEGACRVGVGVEVDVEVEVATASAAVCVSVAMELFKGLLASWGPARVAVVGLDEVESGGVGNRDAPPVLSSTCFCSSPGVTVDSHERLLGTGGAG
jgi:hypothetical protein